MVDDQGRSDMPSAIHRATHAEIAQFHVIELKMVELAMTGDAALRSSCCYTDNTNALPTRPASLPAWRPPCDCLRFSVTLLNEATGPPRIIDAGHF